MTHKVVYTLLTTDTELLQLIAAGSMKSSSPTSSPEVRPFLVIKWGEDTPAFGLTGEQRLEIWVYDEPGSYALINQIIKRIKTILTEAVDIVDTDGERFSTARWTGDSIDLYDDVFDCITRTTTFVVV